MTKETMTIHKALTELKKLDSRIKEVNRACKLVGYKKNSQSKIDGQTIQGVKADMKADYDKLNDLINRRKAIKRAITLSNATTTIKVNDLEMTVAEAIEYSKSGIDYEKMMLDTMTRQYNDVITSINEENGKALEIRANQYVIALYGSAESSKANANEIEKTKQEFIKNNTYDIVDCIDIKKKMQLLADYIANFESEIDSVLSTSNALTTIEIEY